MDETGSQRAPRTFAEKLDYLFRTVHPKGAREFSYRDVAAGIERAGDTAISPTYLMYLRKGERNNPTLQHLEAIARFFKVPMGYFLDDATTARVTGELDVVAALRDADVRALALRVSELSPDGLALVSRMIDEIRTSEGLDDQAADSEVSMSDRPAPDS